MERLLIIAEKPSAARNFAKALGGSQGTFEGDDYVIVNLFGHILAHETPEKVAYPNYAATVGRFNHIQNLPWSYTYFDFDKKVVPAQVRDRAIPVLTDIKQYLSQGYIPVIATDIDSMGEGDLLAQEVLTYVGYQGKIYREYHVDESPKCFQKAMREKKDVTARNEGLLAGTTRSVLDFLTQQLVRCATVTIQEQGYRLPRPVPVGRLQSHVMRLVGDQIKAIADYKPSSVWESRYNLDDILMLTNPDVEQFPTKADWKPGNLPMEATVKEVKVTPGRTAPPKALSLTDLSKNMSSKGLPAKRTMELAQAMYDDTVLSYPRTEDNFITPEQFQEMLPMVDNIIHLLGLSPDVFTHRTPRKTHVKEGGSHGALRPGMNLPQSLDGLDAKYGKGASAVYQMVAERFLMMFLEDTEWVRHDYETTDTPMVFKGSLRIITKKGVTDPDENTDDVATQLPDTSHKAKLYAHEVKSVKPKKPTESWVLGQLKKNNVGTPSTQTSTVARMIGKDLNFPLVSGAKTTDALKLSPIGTVGYQVAKEISLGTAECTRMYEEKIRQVKKDEITQEQVYLDFTDIMRQDVDTIRHLSFDLKGLGFPAVMKKVEGVWNGVNVSIPESCNGYTFTQAELDTLFGGGSVTFTGKDFNGNAVTTSVKLGYVNVKGKQYVGFHDANYCYGLWNGDEIKFKRSFMGYTFSDADCETLLNGGSITFVGTTKDGRQMELTGKLERQKTDGGIEYVGLKAEFPQREGYVRGTFKGKAVEIKGSWSDHKFSDEELAKLFNGETITITFTKKNGGQGNVDGKLTWQMYNGRKFLGFKANFGKK